MEKKKYLKSLKSLLSSITVEPILFSHAFALGLHFVTNETLLLDKVCRTELDYCDSICDNLLTDPELLPEKKMVQQNVAEWVTGISYIQNVPGLLLSLVVGPWSDKHGRKMPLSFTMLFRTLTFIGFLINATFIRLPVFWMVVSWIPTSIFGGFIFAVCLSYLSDITTCKTRTKRISILSGLSFLGIPFGTFMGGVIMRYTGFVGVYATATSFLAAATIYSFVRIEETRKSKAPWKKKIVDFFNLQKFKNALVSVFRKRDGKSRKHIMLSLMCLGLVNMWLSKFHEFCFSLFTLLYSCTLFYPMYPLLYNHHSSLIFNGSYDTRV